MTTQNTHLSLFVVIYAPYPANLYTHPPLTQHMNAWPLPYYIDYMNSCRLDILVIRKKDESVTVDCILLVFLLPIKIDSEAVTE